MVCKNCEQNFEGNFCNHCGQKSSTQRINATFLIHELWDNIFQVDRGVLFTIKELFTRPGHSIRAYLDGKRKQHSKPLAFLLILSTIYVVITFFTEEKTYLGSAFLGIAEGMSDAANNDNIPIKIFKWMGHNHFYASLILLPVFSFSSYLAFKKQPYNFFEHIVLNIYITGQQIVIFLLIFPISFFKGDWVFLDFTPTTLSFILASWTFFQFFKSDKPLGKILYIFLAYFLYFIFLLLIAFLLMFIGLGFH